MIGSNKPWLTDEGKKIWKTEAQYWGWIRGAIRRLWSDYPLRKEWKSCQLRPISEEEKESKKYHPSTKNLGKCHYCGEWFAGSKLECDHKVSSSGCTSKDQAEAFLWYCGGGVGEDWVLSCKPCHSIKTLSDRNDVTFEEARLLQQVIQMEKEKTLVAFLEQYGVKCKAKDRRSEAVKILKGGD